MLFRLLSPFFIVFSYICRMKKTFAILLTAFLIAFLYAFYSIYLVISNETFILNAAFQAVFSLALFFALLLSLLMRLSKGAPSFFNSLLLVLELVTIGAVLLRHDLISILWSSVVSLLIIHAGSLLFSHIRDGKWSALIGKWNLLLLLFGLILSIIFKIQAPVYYDLMSYLGISMLFFLSINWLERTNK